MTIQVNIHDAKTNLSKLLQRVSDGEEVIIARNNKPVARMVPVQQSSKPRKPGCAEGQVLWMSEDFNETPEDFKDYV
jgi:prevent-host-death family protein